MFICIGIYLIAIVCRMAQIRKYLFNLSNQLQNLKIFLFFDVIFRVSCHLRVPSSNSSIVIDSSIAIDR